jgi:hypothetical protein
VELIVPPSKDEHGRTTTCVVWIDADEELPGLGEKVPEVLELGNLRLYGLMPLSRLPSLFSSGEAYECCVDWYEELPAPDSAPALGSDELERRTADLSGRIDQARRRELGREKAGWRWWAS